MPRVPASAHDWQPPVQLLLQQTPCWHRPDAHSVPLVQAVPSVFFEQTPLLQTLGGTQSADVMHMVRHVPVGPHW
jgi:hypothetical protein